LCYPDLTSSLEFQRVWQIAKQQGITPQYARQLAKRFSKPSEVKFKRCGRKPQPLAPGVEQLILSLQRQTLFGAVNLEKQLHERSVKLSHNKIHTVLAKHGLTKREPKKSKRRKWVRWERRHSNSLWHTDWSDKFGKQIILIEDDASRFIVGYGEFSNANSENTQRVFAQASCFAWFA